MGRCIFTGANLIDGDRPARRDVSVVVEGDRIESVCDGSPRDVRPDDCVIELAGRTLMPGSSSAISTRPSMTTTRGRPPRWGSNSASRAVCS